MTEALSIPELENAGVPEGATEKRHQPTKDELLEGLNEPQRAAVVHDGRAAARGGRRRARARPGC